MAPAVEASAAAAAAAADDDDSYHSSLSLAGGEWRGGEAADVPAGVRRPESA
jgi:hypothetical protein